MNKGRIAGILLGLTILASVFALPFAYRGARPLTLHEVFIAVIQFGDYVSGQHMLVGFMYSAAFLLLVTAGVSLLAMAALSIAVYASSEAYWGVGYYAIWVESLVALGNGCLMRAKERSPGLIVVKI
jgi:hypothetical protein